MDGLCGRGQDSNWEDSGAGGEQDCKGQQLDKAAMKLLQCKRLKDIHDALLPSDTQTVQLVC